MRITLYLAVSVAVSALWPCASHAADLVVAISSEITSIDPHFHNTSQNNSLAQNIFDPLVRQDDQQRLIPGLATAWRAIDDTTWEFKLRETDFQDGTPFTAADVAFSLARVPAVPNSPSSFITFTQSVKRVDVLDDHTVRIATAGADPILPRELSTIMIVSRHSSDGATTADFDSGRAAIGTGPFRFVSWRRGDRIELTRNTASWAGGTPWDRVSFRMITGAPARVAALLAGDVDAIENVPPQDVPRIAANAELRSVSAPSARTMYLHMDQARDPTPFATDSAGRPLSPNPLKDVRVRRAIALAINRQALVDRVMGGQATVANQLLPSELSGADPDLAAMPFDPEAARKMLADAGYPDGFHLTFHTSNDRYVNDATTAQAVAQMLTRVGIRTDVEAMPGSVFVGRASKPEFSFILFGVLAQTGDAGEPLRQVLETFDAKRGTGASNRGRYSNPEFDRLVDQASTTVDLTARDGLLRQAADMAFARDVAVVPLFHPANVWAMKRALDYVPRVDANTLAARFCRADTLASCGGAKGR